MHTRNDDVAQTVAEAIEALDGALKALRAVARVQPTLPTRVAGTFTIDPASTIPVFVTSAHAGQPEVAEAMAQLGYAELAGKKLRGWRHMVSLRCAFYMYDIDELNAQPYPGTLLVVRTAVPLNALRSRMIDYARKSGTWRVVEIDRHCSVIADTRVADDVAAKLAAAE